MIYQANAVLYLLVGRKQPHHQVQYTVLELQLQPLTGPVGEDLSRHPTLISRLRLGSNRSDGAAYHIKCLNDIGTEPHPVEQPNEGVNRPLQQIRIIKCDQAVVHL